MGKEHKETALGEKKKTFKYINSKHVKLTILPAFEL